MDPVEGRVQTRGCLAKCSCVHDGTQMAHASFLPVLYYFLLALVSPMRTEGTRGQGRRREAQVGWAGTRGGRKKEGKLAPWIRTHKSSILHVSMAPGDNVRFAILFPILFPSSRPFPCFSLFFLFRFVFATSGALDMKLGKAREKESRMRWVVSHRSALEFERTRIRVAGILKNWIIYIIE